MPDYKEEQSQFWNGRMGRTWVEQQAFIDGMIRPFEHHLVDAVQSLSPRHVLDVGCGNGTTTLSIARALAPVGRCTGIDLSRVMVDNARSRLGSEDLPVTFVHADAGEHDFGPPTFDALCSRFGVMFFPDPVQAFRNLRRAATPDARLVLIVWRRREDNDFMTAGQRAAASLLPEQPPPDPNAPSAFFFGDEARGRDILEAGGWSNLAFTPLDLECAFPRDDLETFVNELAPIGVDLATLDDATAAAVLKSVRAAHEPFVQDDDVRFNAACWVITGRAAGDGNGGRRGTDLPQSYEAEE